MIRLPLAFAWLFLLASTHVSAEPNAAGRIGDLGYDDARWNVEPEGDGYRATSRRDIHNGVSVGVTIEPGETSACGGEAMMKATDFLRDRKYQTISKPGFDIHVVSAWTGCRNARPPFVQACAVYKGRVYRFDSPVVGAHEAPTTNSSTATAANPQVVSSLVPTAGIQFFAGMTDDPFFFDIPAFQAFIGTVRAGAPDPTKFNRARDSFAGYNVMSIALRIPSVILKGTTTSKIGVAFYAQRQQVQTIGKSGAVKGSGSFVTYDRMANPAVNVALIPFNRKNAFNLGTPKGDARGDFADDIVSTLVALGTNTTNIDVLKELVINHGDYLRLELDGSLLPNSGTGGGDNAGSGFPNGRRLRDDTADTLINLTTNGAVTTGDKVNANDIPLQNVFPFLALPQQPRTSGVDDNTRN